MVLLEPKEHFNKCIVGIKVEDHIPIYDSDKVIHTIMSIHNLNLEDSVKWFENNILNVYTGENTFVFLKTQFNLEEND